MQAKDSSSLRVFFALWPSASLQRTLYALAKKYQPKYGECRLMRADTIHMTLQFVGEVRHTRLPQLLKAADRVNAPLFDITLNKLDCWQHNKIAYVAPSTEVTALNNLAFSLRRELSSEGILFSEYEFSPHITLLRHVEHVMEPQSITPIVWRVDAFALLASVTTHKGAYYQILKKWSLPHKPKTISPKQSSAQ